MNVAHRTFSSRRSGGGGSGPPAPTPVVAGKSNFWYRGDAGLTVTANQVRSWTEQLGINANLTSNDPFPNSAPYALNGDTIDGVQLVTFGVAGDANKGLRTGASNPGSASNLVNHVGAPMDGASPRCWIGMFRPDWQAAFSRLGGNPLAHSTWGAIFSLWADITPGGAWAWSHAWGNEDVGWGPQLVGPGSPFNGVPTLIEWRSSVWPNFQFLVNNVLIATVPADISGWVPGGVGPLVLGGPGNPSFLGGTTEINGYDAGLTLPEHAGVINYYVSRYPSAPIVI